MLHIKVKFILGIESTNYVYKPWRYKELIQMSLLKYNVHYTGKCLLRYIEVVLHYMETDPLYILPPGQM